MKRFWTEIGHYVGIAVTIVVSLAPGLALNWWINTDLAYGGPVWAVVAGAVVCALLTFVWGGFVIRLCFWVETGTWLPRPTWASVKAGYRETRRR